MSTPLTGGPDDLTRILGAFEDRTANVEHLAEQVGNLVTETRGLRQAVQHRPSRRYVDRKRRLTAVGVAVWAVIVIFAHDQHIEACSPGAREGSEPDTPVQCDVLFPLHPHDTDPWPNEAHLFGIGGYLLLGGGAYLWTRKPAEQTKREEAEDSVASPPDNTVPPHGM